jgi:hypothetical protein
LGRIVLSKRSEKLAKAPRHWARPVFNRTIGLRDTFAKEVGKD